MDHISGVNHCASKDDKFLDVQSELTAEVAIEAGEPALRALLPEQMHGRVLPVHPRGATSAASFSALKKLSYLSVLPVRLDREGGLFLRQPAFHSHRNFQHVFC